MGIAFALVGLALLTGYAVVRLLGLAKGASTLGLVPGAGLATLAVLATWCGLLGAPAPVAGVVAAACALVGVALVVIDRVWLAEAARGFLRHDPLATVVLLAGLLVPVIAMGVAFARVAAPLSPHDGAFHVEVSEMFRQGSELASWYPPGLGALFGAVLQLTPWVDTAAGAFGLGLGLTLLAPLAVFGLGVAVWRNLLAASAGTLLVSLTHVFLYYPQVWSGWPQLLSLVLVLGLWVTAIGYLESPGWRWAVLAGLLVGAIVVVHGTELYTSAIVLVILASASWRRIPWRRLGLDMLLVAAVAAVCAAPYLPLLLHWAGGGGAYAVGNEDGSAMEQGSASVLQLLGLFSLDALGVDAPVRIVLVVLGLVFAFQVRAGRALVVVTCVFVSLAILATLFNGVPLVRSVFAATYPWSLPYRQLTFASIGLAIIAGGGVVLLVSGWSRVVDRFHGEAGHRRLTRLGRLLVVTWLGLSCCALIVLLGIETSADASFTSDDTAAMAWMRAHVGPDEVVVNDTFGDAGIWAPYKAGVKILFYRSVDDPTTAERRRLVLDNVASLDQHPEAAAAACALNATYVYTGAANSGWQERSLPPVEDLLNAPSLRLAFRQGDAAVFALEPTCA
jgi:hypothetical protein